MKKWIYDKMVQDYSKKSKEELIIEIMSLNEIELKDRSFANQCSAGMTIFNINSLFETIETFKNCLANPNSTEEELEKCADNIWSAVDNAKGSWNYIKSELSEIKDPERCCKNLEDFRLRVSKAKDDEDCI